jgi:hypothetical protein
MVTYTWLHQVNNIHKQPGRTVRLNADGRRAENWIEIRNRRKYLILRLNFLI